MTAAVLAKPLARPARLDLARDALFLDLDGTLAPIAPTPVEVGPDARRTRLLADLTRALGGRLAIVSGRRLEDIDRILGDLRPVVGAVHGLVVRTAAGVAADPGDPDRLERARQVLAAFAATDPRLILEDKGLSLALHYRQAPERGPEADARVVELARELGWRPQPGHAVAELRPPGADKGEVLRRLMQEAPFHGARPIFVGDDATDEDGFAAASAMDGLGVIVGDRELTTARHRLTDVAAVLDWLEASLP